MTTFDNVVTRLTSRKFLLCVAASASFFYAKQYSQSVAVVFAYLGVEGVVDLRAANKAVDDFQAEVEKQEDALASDGE